MVGGCDSKWFDPPTSGYPWPNLTIPVENLHRREAEGLVDQILKAGNHSLQRGNDCDAIWKYSHALVLCSHYSMPHLRVLIKCSEACLNLKYYIDAYRHAENAIKINPDIDQGYYLRAESLRKMLENSLETVPEGATFANVVSDYHQCYKKSGNVEALYQALFVATNNDCTSIILPMTEEENLMTLGVVTNLLEKIVHGSECQQKHFSILLFTFISEKCIDFTSINVTHLLSAESITDVKLIKTLIKLGMKVSEKDITSAVKIFQEANHKEILQLLVNECIKTQKCTFTCACCEAIKAGKLQFLLCLIDNGGKPKVEDLQATAEWSTANRIELYFKMVIEKEGHYYLTESNQPSVLKCESEFSSVPMICEMSDEIAKGSVVQKPVDKQNVVDTLMSRYELLDLDDLPWEVEVTDNVLKFFKSEKQHPYSLRFQAAKTIYELAEGKRGPRLSKRLITQSSDLFEAKFSKGGRIIWQRAIQFSPRRTGENSHNPIYAETLRIWEVLSDHDQLTRTVNYCVEQIKLSKDRCYASPNVHISLKPLSDSNQCQPSIKKQAMLEFPTIFSLADARGSEENIQQYIPAASPKENEFNIKTFYSFSGAVVKGVLTGSNERRDFPFKVWPEEHAIINLPYAQESILVLGRSGTGKTTCCLYRLWNEYKMYWERPEIVSIPRIPLLYSTVKRGIKEVHAASECIADHKKTPCKHSKLLMPVMEERTETIDSQSITSNLSTTQVKFPKEIDEHLHQVFVTRNHVLCAQMKKRFYDMAAACDIFEKHMYWESGRVPHSLVDIDDYAYPLFLTARQFYILLDNSISDEQCFFHPRKENGGLKVRIVSTNYDYEDPDTLLLSEDEYTEDSMQYKEVTSSYFTKFIWPTISKKHHAKSLDPILVWMEIQSFIKGSKRALLKGSALSLQEYLEIGNKVAPNFSDERETIHSLYKDYECYRKKQCNMLLFDECDLIHHIHHRLKKVHDLSWSIHSFYIDEVQDFTQAELTLYLLCCRHPNSLFLTGDTAQSIMKGVSFRFQELRTMFHEVQKFVPQLRVPKELYKLALNFRSHSGILELAGSIINLIDMFFKGTIDQLPEDKGMFPGPTPIILESCKESDLALMLSNHKRESSRIEFGAHQVVIVRSQEAKSKLPSILKEATVFTIFESKGLEFDDVLLYNFFYDSMVDEKCWRVVTAYLEKHKESVKVNKQLPGSSNPRSYQFEEKSHKCLNAELKCLYTAVTRAKCHLWIYDCDMKKRLPMFDLWYKQGLVKVVSDRIGVESHHSLVFASISTPHQWKSQGDYFMKHQCWEQAKHCYDKAGPEYQFLAIEAKAKNILKQAQSPEIYLEAAVEFLYRDLLIHDVPSLVHAAKCMEAKPNMISSAAILFEKLEKFKKALECYKTAKDTTSCVRILESQGQYDEAIRICRVPKEALAKAKQYTSEGIHIAQDLRPQNLSYTYASKYAKRKEKIPLFEVLKEIPDIHKRARFMKIGGFYADAFDLYASNYKIDEAYRLASGQCLFLEGIAIAQKLEKEAEFQLHESHKFFMKNKHKGIKLPSSIETKLDALSDAESPEIRAHALLLLGMARKQGTLCRSAYDLFLSCNKVAALEAFNSLTKIGFEFTTTEVLEACEVGRNVELALKGSNDLNQLVRQGISFYGLQRIHDGYLMLPNYNMWVSLNSITEKQNDLDGMIQLEVRKTKDLLISHITSFFNTWLEKYNIQTMAIKKKFSNSKINFDTNKTPFQLKRVVQVPDSLTKEIMAAVDYYRLGYLRETKRNWEMCDTATSFLLLVISPQISFYLPLTKEHFSVFCLISNGFKQYFKPDCMELQQIDHWFQAWRMCIIIHGNTECLYEVIDELERKIDDSYQCSFNRGSFQEPPAYRLSPQNNYHFHIFKYWLHSCTLIQEKQPLFAAKEVINKFVATVARSMKLSGVNIVYILAIHTMSIFAMLTYHNPQKSHFIVPVTFVSCVNHFDIFNCHLKQHMPLYTSNANEVDKYSSESRSTELKRECLKLLKTALNLVQIGTDSVKGGTFTDEYYGILDIMFENKDDLSSGVAHNCLVLALTLFTNMIPYLTHSEVEEYRERFSYFFHQQSSCYMEEGRKAMETSPVEVLQPKLFQYVSLMLSEGCLTATPTHALMRVNRECKIVFTPLPSNQVTHNTLSTPSPDLKEHRKETQQCLDQQTQLDCFYSTQYTEWEYSMSFFQPIISSKSHMLSSSVVKPFLTTMEYLSSTTFDSNSDILSTINPHLTIANLQGVFYELPLKDTTTHPNLLADTPQDSIKAECEHTILTKEDITIESWDMDEDVGLSISSKQPLLPKVSSDLVHPHIITKKFCNICGVPLHVAPDSGEPFVSGSTRGTELYKSHIHSAGHAKIYKEHKVFMKLYDEKYIWMLNEFECLKKLESLSVKRSIEDISEAIIMFDWKMAEHKNNLTWKKGLSYINEATKNFQRLLMVIKQEHEIECELTENDLVKVNIQKSKEQ